MNNPKHKFNVGDRVRTRTGKVGIIDHVEPVDPVYYINFDGGYSGGSIESNLEPAPEVPKLPKKIYENQITSDVAIDAHQRVNQLIDFCASLEVRIKELEK